jgi:hypothetical protein
MSCCTYSCTQYSLHTQYMLLTHADELLCQQLHTVQSPYTVHASNACWCLAVPTAAHSTVSIFLTLSWFSQDSPLYSQAALTVNFYKINSVQSAMYFSLFICIWRVLILWHLVEFPYNFMLECCQAVLVWTAWFVVILCAALFCVTQCGANSCLVILCVCLQRHTIGA